MNNILITGGCGFIGANFVRYLLDESDYKGNIINIDNLTYAGNPENLNDILQKYADRYIFIKADICDKNKLTNIFRNHQIDTICHFAAESHVDKSIVRPDDFINTNIIGTYNLLEISKQMIANVELFHHISTDEVYGSLGATGYFTEETPYSPNSPYSASKASSDHLVKAYHSTYNLPITISNCSNNYGPYQYPEKLLPLIILNALEGKQLPVYGDGKNIRDWLYVRDHCTAIWTIMKNGKRGDTYNVGGNSEMENIKIVEMICNVIDDDSRHKKLANNKSRKDLIEFVKDRPGHDLRYAIDSTKLKTELKWQPEETLESGIAKTIQWYIDNQQWVKRIRSGEYQTWIEEHYKDMQ